MHALIVTACNNTDLEAAGFDTFETVRDGESAIVATGSEEELRAVIKSWSTSVVHPDPWPMFTAYEMAEGVTVAHPQIVRVGVT